MNPKSEASRKKEAQSRAPHASQSPLPNSQSQLGGKRGARFLLLAVGLAGAGTMVVELSAVRLLAPWFGSSNAVWTHSIGVILLALALGYGWGGRLSQRERPEQAVVRVLLAAAGWCLCLPFLTPIVAGWFMPSGVSLHGASGLLFWGSLACSVVLFLVPALFLGCVAPIAVELLSRENDSSNPGTSDPKAGQAGGSVLALSTLGSLVGTFATTYALVPILGLRLTFVLASGLLAVAAGLIHFRTNRSTGIVAVLVVCGASFFVPEPAGASLQDGTVLAEAQSAYQWIRVVEHGEGENQHRLLVVNEALDSFQSIWEPHTGLLTRGNYYYDYFVPPLYWDVPRPVWKVLILGLGAGTAVRVLEGVMPEGMQLETVGVEIDSEVVRLGQEFFDLEANDTNRRVLSGMDARSALRSLPRDFDQIIVDAYANNMEIPAHLCTQEFFQEVRDHLRPGGWLTANLSGFGHGDPVIQAVSHTIACAFEREITVATLPFSRNSMVYARTSGVVPGATEPGFLVGPEDLQERLKGLRMPWICQTVVPGDGLVLTDDHSPVLSLQRESIERGANGWVDSFQ